MQVSLAQSTVAHRGGDAFAGLCIDDDDDDEGDDDAVESTKPSKGLSARKPPSAQYQGPNLPQVSFFQAASFAGSVRPIVSY